MASIVSKLSDTVSSEIGKVNAWCLKLLCGWWHVPKYTQQQHVQTFKSPNMLCLLWLGMLHEPLPKLLLGCCRLTGELLS